MKKIRMDLQLFAGTQYMIVENQTVSVNGVKTELKRNMKLRTGVNGAVIGAECTGSEISLDADMIRNLKASGAIVEIS